MTTQIPSEFDPAGAANLGAAWSGAGDPDMIARRVEQEYQAQQAFFRQQSGEAENTGEMSTNASASNQATLDAQRKAAEKRKADNLNRILLLDALDAQIQVLDVEIKGHESYFENKHGDAWAEVLANKFLDPDIIPHRQDGESISDYRQRVKDTLIEETLDADGNIKDEYKNHPDPDAQRMAKWAKAQYDKDVAEQNRDIVVDPKSTPEQIQGVEARVETASWNQNRQLKQETMHVNNDASITVSDAIKEASDTALDTVKAADTLENLQMSGFS